ncbi:amindase [Acanthocystis turfacea Chlorella virus MO0605SPH]|nr:amindase [Acanthocystis turfacea Chlorella virus MO0605SPH]AGE60025.1 amindase [Acanthocystis turfacea Chlorella virus WI0606]
MCSGIKIITSDGTILVGRTMEFGQNILKFKKFMSNKIKGVSTPDNKLIDGINRSGLHVMVFYYPKCASFSAPKPSFINVKPTDLAMLMLERCATCDDVEYLAPKVCVINEEYPPFTGTPGMHWMITDLTGRSLVLEPEDGKLSVYDNHVGVFTNSPSFPEHLEEAEKALRKVSQYSDPNALSQGTGAIGLPGDYSSVSRFIRLAFFTDTLVQPKDAVEGINTMIHVLNNFDIVKGAVATMDPKTKKVNYETTIYTVYYNLTDRTVMLKDYANQNIRVL